jgi:hypothetical protein
MNRFINKVLKLAPKVFTSKEDVLTSEDKVNNKASVINIIPSDVNNKA